mmetsp:Transcript_9303/g.30398  ORF Transcript_9303/g.30398 Transcript_9303/m.30398 type:complete len:242 (+) Transcript_9303:701-1426(+)
MRSSLRRGTAPSYRTSPISAATPNSVATTPALLTKRQSPSADSAKRTSSSSTAAAPSIRSSSIALPTRSVQSTTSPRVSEPPAPLAPSVALRASPSTCRISSASEEGPSRSSLEVAAAARCAAAATSTGARNAHAMVLHSSAWSPPPAHSSSTVGTLDAAAFLKRLPMTPLGLGAAGGGGGGVRNEARQRPGKRSYGRRDGRATTKSREWVIQKKEVQRRRGAVVRADSKYTARKRSKVRF